ncbi:MAG: hypothetical protein DRJ40_02880 [Thermoprotei archaeon]|nr:MAG: hypothetical protein DRJ40_02880 [Thermoprotei archaeon]
MDAELLCEVFRRIVGREARVRRFTEKDSVIRRLVSEGLKGQQSTCSFIIVEEGKQRLLSNAALLVSKLRSISRDFSLVLLVDTDHNYPGDVAQELRRRISNIVRQRFRTEFRPQIGVVKSTEHYYVITVTYPRGRAIVMHLVTVPQSLEHWLSMYGNDVRSLIAKRGTIPWLQNLCEVLQRQ